MFAGEMIETSRLHIRQWNAADEGSCIEMNLDREVMSFFPATCPPEQTLAHIEKNRVLIDEKGYGLFALEHKEDRAFIGFTGISVPSFETNFTPCIEIGWRLKKEYWGRGLSTEAARACMLYCFSMIGFPEVFSWTAAVNIASEQVMKKIGMQKIKNFPHPLLPGHRLEEHVLYQISNPFHD